MEYTVEYFVEYSLKYREESRVHGEGAGDRELEWEYRNDQAGEDLHMTKS